MYMISLTISTKIELTIFGGIVIYINLKKQNSSYFWLVIKSIQQDEAITLIERTRF